MVQPNISFLSDFGYKDEFVGVVKSVIRSLAPSAQVIDLTHGIPKHDIRAGGLALARASQHLCPGVVVAVVDPGVGSQRRGVAVEVVEGELVLIGPDNGLLAPAVAMLGGATKAVSLTNTELHLPSAGDTFDGRDVFGPSAAHLCQGVALAELGEEIAVASLIPAVVPAAQKLENQLNAEVLWVDHFGNAQLNVGPDDLDDMGERFSLSILGLPTPPHSRTLAVSTASAYDQVPQGDVGLVVDSQGLVSVVMRCQSASDELSLHEGMSVVLTPFSGDVVELTPRRRASSESS